MRKFIELFTKNANMEYTVIVVMGDESYFINCDENNGNAHIKRVDVVLHEKLIQCFGKVIEQIALELFQDGKFEFDDKGREYYFLIENKTCVIGYNGKFFISYFEDFEITLSDSHEESINEILNNLIKESKANEENNY